MLNISGSYTIYHVLGITPEALDLESATGSKKIKKEIPITQKDIMEMKKSYLPNKKIDFVMLGCPHYTFDQVLNLLSALKIKKSEVPIFILTSRAIIELLNYLGIEEELKHLGADLVPDTCVDEKLVWGYLKNKRGLSDSAKCSYYMSSFGVDIKVLSQKDCIRLAQGEELYV
ncbi:putative aconitase [Peptoniphilus sp. ING2-D1G]|nr:putative aconitase [Peptoniphilus sp. ING2-D1G]